MKAAEEAFYAETVEEPSFEAPVIGDAPGDGAGDEMLPMLPTPLLPTPLPPMTARARTTKGDVPVDQVATALLSLHIKEEGLGDLHPVEIDALADRVVLATDEGDADDEDDEDDMQPNEHGAAQASTRPRRSRNRLLRIMQEFGIVIPRNHVGAAGNTKRIPPQFLFNTHEVRLRLAAGLIDSDGYYNPVTNSYHLTQADSWHAELFEDIYTLFKGLGFVTNVQKWTHESRGYSTLYVGGEHLSDIPCLLARKQAPTNARLEKAMVGFRFEGMEGSEERDWVEIDVSGDKRFLRNDFFGPVSLNDSCAHFSERPTARLPQFAAQQALSV